MKDAMFHGRLWIWTVWGSSQAYTFDFMSWKIGAHGIGRTHCVKLVRRLYPEVDPALNPDHVPHMLHKCPDQVPDPKADQYVRNDRGTPRVLDNNYYKKHTPTTRACCLWITNWLMTRGPSLMWRKWQRLNSISLRVWYGHYHLVWDQSSHWYQGWD